MAEATRRSTRRWSRRSVAIAVRAVPVPRRLGAALVVGAVLVTGAVGCGRDGPAVPAWQGVEVVEGGACGDVTFWAVNEERDVVLRVMLAALARSEEEPTEVSFSLPNRGIMVDAIHGADLPNYCEGSGAYQTLPSGVRYSTATAGSGVVSLGPRRNFDAPGCGTTGRLELDGLVTEDGTAFAPVTIEAVNVGCYEADEGAGDLGTVG